MHPKWISVKDRLPENSGIPYTRYLVAHINRMDKTKLWIGIQYWVDDKWDMKGITHWMALPGKPEFPYGDGVKTTKPLSGLDAQDMKTGD